MYCYVNNIDESVPRNDICVESRHYTGQPTAINHFWEERLISSCTLEEVLLDYILKHLSLPPDEKCL